MSIKPCPACDSDYDGDWSHGTAGPQLVCGNPGCKLCGPCGDDMEDAEKRWNAMPRRGDGPAWRSEPPDQPGYWWTGHIRDDGSVGGASLGFKIRADVAWYQDYPDPTLRFAGPIPIPEPPAPDAEKEAAK